MKRIKSDNRAYRCLRKGGIWKYMGLLALLSGSLPVLSAPEPVLSDPLRTTSELPPSPAGPVLDKTDQTCPTASLPERLDLIEAVERALCTSPKTARTWAEVKAQTAQVGLGRGAFLPNLAGSVQFNRSHVNTDIPSAPGLSSTTVNRFRQDTLNLSWTLFDFGARQASLDAASHGLAAALYTHDLTLQEVFFATARNFHTAIAAGGALAATTEMEIAARQSLAAATARVAGGVAPVSDQLQANTAMAKALYNRSKAEGDFLTARGTLALDMGFPPELSFQLAEQQEPANTFAETLLKVDALLQGAAAEHPAVLAARSRLAAAESKRDAALRSGLPSISLSAKASRGNQGVSPSLGQALLDAESRERFVGLQLNLPLFDGFSTVYKVRAAKADVDIQQNTLNDTLRQIAEKVWSSYQLLRTGTENLRHTEVLLDSARQQHLAARKRYEHGVTGILELMASQSALADALQQRTQALSEWRTARLQLAASLGKLGMENIR